LSGFASRWVVAREYPVAAGDLAANGELLDATLERFVLVACAEYLERCRELQARGLTTTVRVGGRTGGEQLHGATGVLVSVRATEVLPDSFVLAVRLRGPDGVVDTTCEVRLEDATGVAVAVDDAIRDELIALEHAAAHVN
jgi:hypothetical protein